MSQAGSLVKILKRRGVYGLIEHLSAQAFAKRQRSPPRLLSWAWGFVRILRRHGFLGLIEHFATLALVSQLRPERDSDLQALEQRTSPAEDRPLRGRLRAGASRAGTRLLDVRYEGAFGRLLSDPRVPLLPERAFRDTRLQAMIGSLGPGGAERQLVTLLRGLLEQGHEELELVALFLNGDVYNHFRPWLDESRIRITELRRAADPTGALIADLPDHPGLCAFVGAQRRRMPSELVEIWYYLREILARRPGVFHGWMDDVNVKGGIAAAIAGVPRIVLGTRSVAPNNFDLFQPFMRAAYRSLLRLPQVTVLNNSIAGARDYERWLDVPNGSIHVVRNGFDFAPFDKIDGTRARSGYRSRLGVPADACVVGTIIRFTEEKQPFLWLETAVRVSMRHPDVRFLMLGDGPLREAVATRSREAGLGQRLLLPGYEGDTLAALAAMDVFMLTSRVEGLPNVLIEAQAMGLPVVAPRVGGVPETLQPDGGWLVTRLDAEAFAQVASEAVSDPVALTARGRRARESVRESFQIQPMVSEVLGHYSWPMRPSARQGTADAGRPGEEELPLSARSQGMLAAFLKAFPQSPPITVVVEVGRCPCSRDAWLPLLGEPGVASLLFVHERPSDDGFVQNDREGFVSYVTGVCRPPRCRGKGALSLSGEDVFQPWLLSQLSEATPGPLEFVAFLDTASSWQCLSMVEISGVPAQRSSRASRPELRADPGERRRRLKRSRQFSRFWPPHRTGGEGLPTGHRARLWALTTAYAEEIERQEGMPLAPAQTTLPLRAARGNPPGPIVIACMSLKAGGAERQAALTARGTYERGWPTVFLAYDEQDDVGSHHYAPLVRGAGVPLLNAGREAPFPALDDGPVALEEKPSAHGTDRETRLALDDRCNALRLGIAPMLRRYFASFMRIRPRLVHTWLDYTNTVAGLAALWAGVPRLVLGFRNLGPMRFPLYQPFFRPIYRLLIQDPRTVLMSNSRAGARDYADWLGLDEDRIRIVENAFEPELHDLGAPEAGGTERPPDASPLVLGAFRFYFEKDPLLFVRTAAEIARELPEARFRLIGEGELKSDVEAEVERLGLSERLKLVGSRKNVLAEMRHANLLLHTARAEGLPNVLLEAQAAGLPLLTTSAGGCVEAIDPGITGVVLDTRNPEDLAREAVRLLRSPEWLANAREEGPGFVRQHFSLEAMLDKTWAVYGLPKAPPSSEGRPMSSEGPVILPRPLVWTPELVTRFWDGMARAGLDEVMAFGRMARRCILWLVGRHLVPGGRHLDYGSGGGEVAAYLIEHGFPFAVLEPSVERQRSAESRLSSLAGFLGCPGPEDVGGYDAVTCFEVLEHVLDDRFEAVCDEIASYVRPGGRLIISTPNNEDLARDTVYCPVSNHTFHRWQHVRRIDQKTLESAFARRGFRKVCTHQLDFDENLFQPYLYLMGLAEPAAGSAKQMPLHIHQVLNDIDGVMGGATRLLHVAVKEG